MRKTTVLVLAAVILPALAAPAQGTKADYERAAGLRQRMQGKVIGGRVEPHWLPGATQFWYRIDRAGGRRENVLVDAVAGTRRVITDAERAALATEIAKAGGPVPESEPGGGDTLVTFVNRSSVPVELFWNDPEGHRQSYGTIAPGQRRRQHTYAGHVWIATGPKGETLTVYTAQDEPAEVEIGPPVVPAPPPRPPAPARGAGPADGKRRSRPPPRSESASPDGRWTAILRDRDVYVRRAGDGAETRLTSDGREGDAYEGRFHWSPDSSRLVVFRVRAAAEHPVYEVESSPKDRVEPRLQTFNYLKPGDEIELRTPRLFDVAAGRAIEIRNDLFPTPWSLNDLRWAPDSSRFTMVYNQRGHQVLRLLAVDARTGGVRAIVDEQSPTFIDYSGKFFCHPIDATREVIWMSERDGWNHLWLFDADAGRVKNQITRGEWVVRGVDRVDEQKRQIWFRAGGIRPGQDPYFVHFCRVNFDGTGLVVLTEGDGTHEIEWSPDGRFLLDTWSRVDQPPVCELRRADDGGRVCELERADATALRAAGWQAPEPFRAKGRDGATDIHGVIYRPTVFDPARRYPVVEDIYAGPHDSFVPKAFRPVHAAQAIAELGFVVVQIDGMGTSNRSKKFHDVCWKNLGDAGFPDRIAWMKAAAATRPWMDLGRVGIYGGSAGGQNALRALLAHGDFYKVAVADCGCHDNRMDKIWWNEQWMGWPVGPHYAEQSNVTQAHRLQGKLLLVVGELDHNVDPASTMQVVNALVKADKDFDLLVMPGAGHGAAETPYGRRRRADFLVRHLLGVEPRAQ